MKIRRSSIENLVLSRSPLQLIVLVSSGTAMEADAPPVERLLLSLSPFESFVLVSSGNATKTGNSPREALSLSLGNLKFIELVSWLRYVCKLRFTAEIVHFQITSIVLLVLFNSMQGGGLTGPLSRPFGSSLASSLHSCQLTTNHIKSRYFHHLIINSSFISLNHPEDISRHTSRARPASNLTIPTTSAPGHYPLWRASR